MYIFLFDVLCLLLLVFALKKSFKSFVIFEDMVDVMLSDEVMFFRDLFFERIEMFLFFFFVKFVSFFLSFCLVAIFFVVFEFIWFVIASFINMLCNWSMCVIFFWNVVFVFVFFVFVLFCCLYNVFNLVLIFVSSNIFFISDSSFIVRLSDSFCF